MKDDYPLNALGPLTNVARAIAEGFQCAPALAGQAVLAAAALLVQGVANVRGLDGRIKPTSIYALSIANSGDGKDTADGMAFHPIREWQREAGKKYRRMLAKVGKEDMPPSEPYRFIKDITIEGLRRAFEKGVSSQGVYSTEAASMLVGHALSSENRLKTAAALCSLWDGAGFSVARASSGRFERPGTRVSSHLMVQPTAVAEVLTDTALQGVGFWPRFLLAWPSPLPPRKYKPFRPDQSPEIVAFWQRCNEILGVPLHDDNDNLPALELDDGAISVLGLFLEECEQRSRCEDWQSIQPFGLRAAEIAVRVAAVQTVFAKGDLVGAESARKAVELVRHSLQNWLNVIEEGVADPIANHAITLYEWLIGQSKPVRLPDLLRLGPGSLRSKGRRDAAVERLVECGLVEVRDGLVAIAS